ncbi:hypothetical protein A235_05880, partial [Pseudomonas syringae pv. actinidiae ICMP 19079]
MSLSISMIERKAKGSWMPLALSSGGSRKAMGVTVTRMIFKRRSPKGSGFEAGGAAERGGGVLCNRLSLGR